MGQKVNPVGMRIGVNLIKGGLPGAKKSIVTIRSTIKEVKHPEVVKPLVNRTPAPVVNEAPAEAAPVAEEAKAE